MIRRILGILVTLLFAMGIQDAKAQVVRGRIINQDGNPLPGVLIGVTGSEVQVSTNASGVFRFFNLPKGKYELISLEPSVKMEKMSFEIENDELNLGDVKTTENASSSAASDIATVTIDDLQSIDDDDNSAISSVLTSGRDPFDEAATFNLSNGRFRARGYNNEDTELYFMLIKHK
ncbi:MAG TPA: carboxypeptidase-like regulatory domain-containing protein [Saprospiraceae bacterium]|nr:carboxypeptidase-like regulatory domain-containing protein [Saprospiraceae bacterium]